MSHQDEERELLRETLESLQWEELCQELSKRASGPLGAQLCNALMPETSREDSIRSLSLTREMAGLREEEGGLPLHQLLDLTPVIDDALRGKILSGRELLEVLKTLEAVRSVRAFIEKNRQKAPGLWELAQGLQELTPLRATLSGSIDNEGELREENFPRLRSLRRRAARLREDVIGRLEAFIRDPSRSRVLQDRYYTLRERRYVLPVRTEAKGLIQGIIHDLSSSGHTCYLEPPWLVEMNNAWRMAEAEAQKETERILESLSREVARSADALLQDLRVMGLLDLINAKARLSLELGGAMPQIVDNGEIWLPALRHPLMVLRGVDAVPNDVYLGPSERILVISGPNAGGKTVLLKAVGLAVMMAKAGLFVAAAEGCRLPFFSKVLADMGDPQDLSRHISTFSGHMRNIKTILQSATTDTLMLLDELAGSTDPQEGASLARAVLEELLERGSRAVVTTHYGPLKAWALSKDGVISGSMEFDSKLLEPTYRLQLRSVGVSSALETAAKSGIPRRIIDRARSFLEKGDLEFERAVSELEKQREALERETEKLNKLRMELDWELKRSRVLNEALRSEKEAFVREKRKRLSREIQDAKRKLKESLMELSNLSSAKGIHDIRRKIKEVEEDLRIPISPPEEFEPIDLDEARAGLMVYVLPLGKAGVLLDEPKGPRGRVRVLVEDKEVWVSPGALGRTGGPLKAKEGPKPVEIRWEGRGATVARTLDLRGKRVEDALEEMERFVHGAISRSADMELIIIHGHGTGALKRAVRQWLSECEWISEFRPGEEGEGGDGVTVVRVC